MLLLDLLAEWRSHKVFIVFVRIFLADSGKLLKIVVCFSTFVPSFVDTLHVHPLPYLWGYPLCTTSSNLSYWKISYMAALEYAVRYDDIIFFIYSKFRWVLYTIRDLGSRNTRVCIFRHFFSLYQLLIDDLNLWPNNGCELVFIKYSIRCS